MDENELEQAVKQIIEKYVDVSYASSGYKEKLAKAISNMTKYIQEFIDDSRKKKKNVESPWLSVNYLNNLRISSPFEYLPPEFTIPLYEDALIERDLVDFVKTIDTSTAKIKYSYNPKAFMDKTSEISILGFLAHRLCQYSMNKTDTPADYEEVAGKFLQLLERDISGCWNYETAETVYQRIYQFHKFCNIRSSWKRYLLKLRDAMWKYVNKISENSVEHKKDTIDRINDDSREYEVRKETEEFYEEFCRATNRPFIVLPDLFYDIREINLKYIMGYRSRDIEEHSQYYAERYRTDENAWFWKSIDKAQELYWRYYDGDVGHGVDDFSSRLILSFYLFDERFALLSYKCNHLSDETEKHREIVEFVNYQYHRTYPKWAFLGYPVMYKDICSYIGVNPVNLASYEETEKEIRLRYEKERKELRRRGR